MTDRERLLEQVREAEERASEWGTRAAAWAAHFKDKSDISDGLARVYTKQAAHHALTALALRDAVQCPTPLLTSLRAKVGDRVFTEDGFAMSVTSVEPVEINGNDAGKRLTLLLLLPPGF